MQSSGTATGCTKWVSILALLVLAVFLTVPPAFAQTFGLDSYIPEKFTDTQWRVAGNSSLSGSDHNERSYQEFPTPLWSKSHSDYDAKGLSASSEFRYRFETIPKSLDFSLFNSVTYAHRRSGGGYQYSPDDDERQLYENTSLDEYVDLQATPRIRANSYFDGDFFGALDAEAFFSYRSSPDGESRDVHTRDRTLTLNRDTQIYSSSSLDRVYNGQVSILGGWGRVYEGYYASTALYIIDELRNNGLLLSEPTFDQMMELTEIVYQYRLKHAIDSRLHKIEATNALSAYLAEQGILEETTGQSAYLIDDVWRYFPKESRRFGFRVLGGIGLQYFYDNRHDGNRSTYQSLSLAFDESNPGVVDTTHLFADTNYWDYTNRFDARIPFVVLMLEYFRPFAPRWQLDGTLSGRYFLNAHADAHLEGSSYTSLGTHIPGYSETDYSDFYDLHVSGMLRYIFDSRTSAYLSGAIADIHTNRSITLIDSQSSERQILDDSFSDWQYSIGLGVTYRISIPTTLTIDISRSSIGPASAARQVRAPVQRSSTGASPSTDIPSAALGLYDENSTETYNVGVSIAHYIF